MQFEEEQCRHMKLEDKVGSWMWKVIYHNGKEGYQWCCQGMNGHQNCQLHCRRNKEEEATNHVAEGHREKEEKRGRCRLEVGKSVVDHENVSGKAIVGMDAFFFFLKDEAKV